jgi:branched-chain amino acid transport system substrate-binding protein
MKKFLLAVAAAVLLSLPTAALADGHTVKIAVVGPLTGDLASFGEQMERGAHAAVADLNAAGGVNGKEVELVEGDDRCDPKEAVAVANRMVNEGVVFVAGHACSGSSIPASEVYWEEGILQITPASTAPQLTENGYDNVFRTCGRDDQQGSFAGNWLARWFGKKRIAIIHDKSSYGKGLADQTRAAYEKRVTGTVHLYESINAGEVDYSALVSRLKNEGVEAVYYGGYHTEMGLIIRQAAAQEYKPKFVSGDGQVTEELWSITGDSGEGILFTFAPDPRSNPDAASLVERFRSEGYEPEGYTLYTYAAIQVWAESARKAGSFDTGAVSDAMRGGNFSTVIGPLSFDSKGDRTTADYTWYKWTEGNYAEVGIDYKP